MSAGWIFGRQNDLTWFFIPVWLCWLIFLALPSQVVATDAPFWIWVLFVVGIDVSHVWSTIFRTYLDKQEFSNHRVLLLIAPSIAFFSALILGHISIQLLWRILAYLAVFHFIKQQYGFMRIYKAKEKDFARRIISDDFILYASTIFPLIYWHLNGDRLFHWFMDGDFFLFDSFPIILLKSIHILYIFFLIAWILQEIIILKKKFWSGKVLWILTTAINWYLGIVYFNSDLVFTVSNVVAHGIPYIALVIFYQKGKKSSKSFDKYILSVLMLILLFAATEEILWDITVNHSWTSEWLNLDFIPYWPVWFTAILSVPQVTHYIIDGFIWKNSKRNPFLHKSLFQQYQ